MALNCRIFRDEKGDIDFVQTPNGNRSKLFDTLVNMTGGNKDAALNLYALTELEDFKDITKAKINSFKERLKNTVKIAPSDVNFSIVGIRGAQNLDAISGNTVIVDNLEVAIDMEKSNETPLKIKIATGWQRGADNEWKYELDSSKVSINFKIDSMAKLGKKYNLKSVLKYPELFKAYPELNNVKISISKKGGTTTEGFFNGTEIVLGIESNKLKDFFEAKSRLEKYKNLDPEVLRIVNKNLEVDAYQESLEASGMSFLDALDNTWEKYPYNEREADLQILQRLGYAEMTKSSVSDFVFLAGNDSFYKIVKDFKEGSDETLQKSDFNNLNEVLLPVTLHEIQHWIQKKEGFANGANTIGISFYLTEEQKKEYKNLIEASKKVQEELNKEGKKWYDEPSEIRDIILAPNDYLHQKYLSAMGEEEARNVEKRLRMTPKERLYSMLADTEDNVRENQIFISQKNQISFNQLQPNQKEVVQEVTDRLEQSGLAKNVYQMSNSEIETKLIELGIDPELAKQVVAYHGSPHSFDRFTTNAMGTGEGAQAFGWGLYFTDLKSIARSYAKDLSALKFKGKDIDSLDFFDILFRDLDASYSDFYDYKNGRIHNLEKFKEYIDDQVSYLSNIEINEQTPSVQRLLQDYEYREEKIKEAKEYFKRTKDSDIDNMMSNLISVGIEPKLAKELSDNFKSNSESNKIYLRNAIKYLANRDTKLETIIDGEKRRIKSYLNYFNFLQKNFNEFELARNLYKVSLHKGKQPSEYTWLEWDKPISNSDRDKINSQFEKENLPKEISSSSNETMSLLGKESNFKTYRPNPISGNGEAFYTNLVKYFLDKKEKYPQKEASLFLLRAGIDGIKYPAESISRGATSDTARGFNYVVFDENAITIEDQVQFSKKGIDLNTAGFTYQGDVYLNTDVMGLDTPIHEFGHLHLDWLKENRSDLYQAGLSLISKNKKEAQQYINIVKETQPDLKEGTEKFNNEVLAQVIGDQGARLINSKKEGSIAEWLNNVWEAIKDILGLSDYTAEQVANMTLADFGRASASEMLSGSRIQRGQSIKNSDIRFSVLSDYRDNTRFAYSDLIYPDVVFKDIEKTQDVKTAINFYKKIIAKFNKTFDRDLKIETSEKNNDFNVTVEYETGLRPKYFAYPTAVMGEHETVDNIDKNVPLTSLRHELIHEMLVKNITDKFERINNLDNSANIESIEEVQRNRAYNYTLEDVFFERVVENIERNPDNKDTFEVSTYGTDVINAIKKELDGQSISKEKVISTLKTLLEGSNPWLSSTLLDIFENKLDYNVKDLSELSESLGQKFKTKFIASKNIFSKDLQEKINDFTKFFNEEYTGVLTRLDKQKPKVKPQDIVAGNKLFNAPLEEASVIADEYISEKGLSPKPIQKITKLDIENSKRIAKAFDEMEVTPNDPETKAAYQAMINETLDQYEKILNKGYKIEINNTEPYSSSSEMIEDLRNNKRMKIFSTESGFGDVAITDKQRSENPLLQETKYKDTNGLNLLANDIFRFVHDFFGHAKFGNGFGPIGEENAWNVHSMMYSPLARRAMTTETRGQNSWVNFSGVNDEAFEKRDKARVLRQEGKLEEAEKLTQEVYEQMSFADQKVGLLPEWVSNLSEEPKVETTTSNVRTPVIDMNGARVFAANRVNPITGEDTGQIELQLLESDDKGKGNARKAAEAFLKYTDSIGKDVYIAVSSRDGGITKEDKLVDFYRSLGFRNTSDFEMIRKARPIFPKGFDKNGEPDTDTILQFNSAKLEPLTNEEILDVRNSMVAFGLTSSKELYTTLMDALSNKGVITFSRVKLERSKMFNNYEIDKIMSSPEMQTTMRETILKLRNTEDFSAEYNPIFAIPVSSELTMLGKQKSSNPFETEREVAEAVSNLSPVEIEANLEGQIANKYAQDKTFKEVVDNINKTTKSVVVKTIIDGQLVDKLPGTIGALANTITDEYNGDMSEDIMFLNNDIRKETWEENRTLVAKILNKIKKLAVQNGIDLKDLSTKAITHSREDILDLLDSMENLLENPSEENLVDFTNIYNEIFDITEPVTELIQTDNKSDIFVDTDATEYELFRDHGLIKKQDGVYRITKDQDLANMYENMIQNIDVIPTEISTIAELRDYVQKTTAKLELPDFQVDTELLEKMVLYKMYFGFPLTVTSKVFSTDGLMDITMDADLLKEDFVRDFNKFLLETDNRYFEVTERGIELISKDEISKAEAILTLPEDIKESLAQYDTLSKSLNLGLESKEKAEQQIDSQKEKRLYVTNNPQTVKKLKGNYSYLEDGVMATKNETETFVRTPVGVFEMIYQFGNVRFYNKLPDVDLDYKLTNIEKPLSDIDFSKYQHLETSPEIFKESKKYYTKKELEQINQDYFNCK